MNLKPVFMICVLFSIRADVEGFASWCNVNQTLFVPVGTNATFVVDNPLENWPHYMYFRLMKTSFIVGIDLRDLSKTNWNFSSNSIWFYDPLIENRSFVEGQFSSGALANISITISDVRKSDNGTYYTRGIFSERKRYCWILFVMEMNQEPRSAIEENQPVYVYAHPHASLIARPLVNATMVWLLDGLSANQTGKFIVQDGYIWITRLRRDMFGRNITYRAIQDNGIVNDANLTLIFTYGPSKPLILIPEKKQYYLASGDMMPDITCTTDCYPQCTISWGKDSTGSTLSLGTVSIDNTGGYTCTATRLGVETAVIETINIYVTDNTSTTIAIAVLASVQALTTVALGFCAFRLYIRNKEILCQKCFKTKASSGSAGDILKQSADKRKRSGIELEHYEDLNIETTQTIPNTPYAQVNMAMPENIAESELQMYENTKLA